MDRPAGLYRNELSIRYVDGRREKRAWTEELTAEEATERMGEVEVLDDPARAVLDLSRVGQRLTVLNRQGLAVEARVDRITVDGSGETLDVGLTLLGTWVERERERFEEVGLEVPIPKRSPLTHPPSVQGET